MKYNQALASFKAMFPEKHLINLIKISRIFPQDTWELWLDNQGTGIKVNDSKIISYRTQKKSVPQDIFYFSPVQDLLQEGKVVIFVIFDNILSAWILGNDNYLRVRVFNQKWQIKNIFDFEFPLVRKISQLLYTPEEAKLGKTEMFYFHLPLRRDDIELMFSQTQNEGFLCFL